MWRHRRFWTIAAAILALATLGKQFSNDWHSYTHKGPERGLLEAKIKGLYVATFRIDPPKLTREEVTFDFGEAWVEAKFEQRDFLVWFSDVKRADWDYFCLRPKTSCFQNGVFISRTPEFIPPIVCEGLGKLDFFSERGDLHFQSVPTDLQRLRITVTANLQPSGRTITVGTAELTRE